MDAPMETEYDLYLMRAERRRRLRILAVAAPTGLALILLLVAATSPGRSLLYGISIDPTAIFLMAVASLALATASALMIYLQTGFRPQTGWALRESIASEQYLHEQGSLSGSHAPAGDLRHLMEEVRDLRSQVHLLSKASDVPSGRNTAEEISILTTEVASRASKELIAKVEQRLEEEVRARSPARATEKVFLDSVQRLYVETSAQGWRGNLNLVLGGIVTVVGVLLLAFFVLYDKAYPTEPIQFADPGWR
jgi:hypothetical protein